MEQTIRHIQNQIAFTRKQLINHLDDLGNSLKQEAALLSKNPECTPNPMGIIQGQALRIDLMACEIGALKAMIEELKAIQATSKTSNAP